jgi:YgiT-type zinc finger domain-containing protein
LKPNKEGKGKARMTEFDTRKCALCSGQILAGSTTFTVDYRDGSFIARNVPAAVCEQCGEAWITDQSAQRLESLLQDAKAARRQLEIVDLAA